MNERPSFAELTAFAAIARHRSFRVAAEELELSASTLSHMMRLLETRLGLRLLNRTTRSVAPTEAGDAFLASLTPVLRDLDYALINVGRLRSEPSGTLRINASRQSARLLLQYVAPAFLASHSQVRLDVVAEGRLVDIVAEGFDAGVRLGEKVPQDMVAVRFGPETHFVVIASPAYLEANGAPQTPDDLAQHICVRFRLPSGKIYSWEFELHGQAINVEVHGPLTLDDMDLMLLAAIRGLGVAFVSIETARSAIERGRRAGDLERLDAKLPRAFLVLSGA